MSVIEITGLGLKIKKDVILHDVSLSLEKGKIYGIVGRNGSGKTMLMKCICGFVKPTSGTIVVQGQIVGKDVDFPGDIGLIIESPGFIPYYSGIKNLKILAKINGKIGREEIMEAIELAGLAGQENKLVRKYSLGMRQRLGLAQAIMENPSIYILDEPMNGLDEEGVEEMRSIFMDLKKKGKTILLVSHNSEDIKILCDQIFYISKGTVQ